MNIPLFYLSPPVWAKSLSRGQSLLKRQIRIIFKTQNRMSILSLTIFLWRKMSHRISVLSICLFLLFFFPFSPKHQLNVFYILPTCPFPTSQIFFIFPWRLYVLRLWVSLIPLACPVTKHNSVWREPPKNFLEQGWVSILP